jgi:hypothetical protein
MDFEETEVLGKGGFGQVVKAKNRLDGRFYAIKKIKFARTDSPFVQKLLREVTTLSRLHHQHVVRYYHAWIDDAEDDQEEMEDIDGEISDSEEDDGLDSEDDDDATESDWFGTSVSRSKTAASSLTRTLIYSLSFLKFYFCLILENQSLATTRRRKMRQTKQALPIRSKRPSPSPLDHPRFCIFRWNIVLRELSVMPSTRRDRRRTCGSYFDKSLKV